MVNNSKIKIIIVERMSWFEFYPKQETAKYRIFCFPFSGGSPTIFSQWSKQLPTDLEVVGICLPGRGKRYSHPLCLSMKELIHDLSKAIIPLLTKPYFFYGHSMGGMVVYELVQELRTMGAPLPLRLFAGASVAPIKKNGRLQPGTISFRSKTQEEMKQVLRNLGGTPEEVLNSKELMDVILPVVSSDLILAQEYVHERVDVQIPVPITYFKATKDTAVTPDRQTWNVHTSSYKQIDLDCGHFFLSSHTELFLALLAKEIKESLNGSKI